MAEPQRRIFTERDVHLWCRSKAYTGITAFIMQLNEAVVDTPIDIDRSDNRTGDLAVDQLLSLLGTLDTWIDDIPPVDSPQRFGNVAFRDWGRRLEEPIVADAAARSEIVATLLNAFGSFTRIDYGTGHELSFMVVLWMMTQLGVFDTRHRTALVAHVFVTYWKLVTRLQLAYKLEPAGSHGVWGLDDYCFMPYIFGSAQVRNSDAAPALLFSADPSSAFPSMRDNLYARAVSNIDKFKKGPWHEHSPQLYTIAHTVPNYYKVNKGMLKMFDAEVLRKRVVVQHLLFSPLFPFETDPEARSGNEEVNATSATSIPPKVNSDAHQPSRRLQNARHVPTTTHNTLLPPLLSRSERKKQTQTQTLASSGSAAASTSPFGVLSKPS
ncbi:hypothetical protein E3P99_01804 [Wallemia hederae]|uniref:Serine/threonine-protein phosphatase 2A activator n=1 Tax=Wallemia hederae TaxID=1540922 RepID=A0A4T0FNA4_9BASI|nr:hypothetical protein E3P99_01804 [Wallemia hederae]